MTGERKLCVSSKSTCRSSQRVMDSFSMGKIMRHIVFSYDKGGLSHMLTNTQTCWVFHFSTGSQKPWWRREEWWIYAGGVVSGGVGGWGEGLLWARNLFYCLCLPYFKIHTGQKNVCCVCVLPHYIITWDTCVIKETLSPDHSFQQRLYVHFTYSVYMLFTCKNISPV